MMARQRAETPSATAPVTDSQRLWTVPYVFVCLAAFLGYANYGILLPTLPLFIADLGGSSATVGLALAAFSITSFTVRPFIGRLTDAWSPRGVFGIGTLLVGIGGLGYLTPFLPAVFVGRAVQGFGWAGLNTGATTMVARLSPAHRRGEASGYFQTGLMIASGMLPAAALWFLDLTNFTAVFLVASVSALAGSGLSLAIRLQKRAAPVRQAESLLASLVERGALLPSALLLLLNLSFPAAAAFVPLYAREIGVENVALFFLIQGTANVVTQATLGRLSDRIGRSLTIAIGFFIAGTGLVLLSQASNFANLTAGGAIYAFGSSVANPALMAMVMDRAQPAKIGAAMATYSLSFQIGSAGGALAGGYLIRWSGFESMYLVVILPLLIGIGITWLLRGARPVHAAV